MSNNRIIIPAKRKKKKQKNKGKLAIVLLNLGGTQIEQVTDSREAKVAGFGGTEYWRRGPYTKKELQKPAWGHAES